MFEEIHAGVHPANSLSACIALSALLLVFVAPRSRLKTGGPTTNPGFVHFYNNEFDEAIACFDGNKV